MLALRHDMLASPARQPAVGLAARARITHSIRDIGAEAWNACFPGELEDYHYLLAVEEAGIEGFGWRYVCVEEEGRIVAAMPAFLTDYRLDTTLDDGMLRRAVRRLRRIFPRFLTMKLACLGSPETECGRIGFHSSIAESRKPALAAQAVAAFEDHARKQGYALIGIKDAPAEQKTLWAAAAPDYSALPGMATAILDIDFQTMDDYLHSRFSRQTRKDMRRKLKAASAIRIEWRTRIDDVSADMLRLYQATRERSEFQFDELTDAYFRGVLAWMPCRAFCTLYWQQDTLLAFNLLLQDRHTLLDKFFCMDAHGRAHNLYFLSWFHNVRYCLEHGISHYQSGQAGEHTKRRLGSRLHASWMLFKHINPLMGGLLKLVAPLLAMGEDA